MFDKYSSEIKRISSFDKNNILSEKFLLFSKNNMEIYYAPHNEIINDKAKIFIVGITPEWTQTSIAYKTARDGLMNNLKSEDIKKKNVKEIPDLREV